MTENDKKPLKTIPYIPFKTFIGFIDRLKQTVVPPIIDHSLLATMSGSMKGQLLSSLRFLNLLDSNNVVQESLKKIINTYKTDSWQESFGCVLFDAYHDIIGNVDLDTGTAQQLYDAFKKSGNLDGQMLDKAVRFYLAGLEASGLKYSPHFKARPRKTTVRKNKKGKKRLSTFKEDETEFPGEEDIDDIQRAQFRIAVPGKKDVVIYLPNNIDQHDWEMVKTMLDAYVSRLTKMGGDD